MVKTLPKILDIVIVNWNSGKRLKECLDSIEASYKKDFILSKVWVVDNNSSDDSLKYVEDKKYTFGVEIIRNSANRGFAFACNQAALMSRADYILFLNPDVRLFTSSLKYPVLFMNKVKNRMIGILGIQLIDKTGRVSRTCSRFPTVGVFMTKIMGLNKLFPNLFNSQFMLEWDHMNTRIVDQVMGAFFLVRKTVFRNLGGFDIRFFMYFEEVDFCYRASKRGWKTVYLAEAQAYHEGGGSSKQVIANRLFYSLRSRIIYSFKHFNIFSAILVMFGTLFVEPLTRLIYLLFKRDVNGFLNTIKAYLLLYKNFGNLVGIIIDVRKGRRE